MLLQMVPEEVRETVPFVPTACFYCFLILVCVFVLFLLPVSESPYLEVFLACFKFEEKFVILFEVSKSRAWKS
jgi:hypothetical protein